MLYSDLFVQHRYRIETLLMVLCMALAIYTFAPLRIALNEFAPYFAVKLITGYFGQACIFSSICLALLYLNRLSLSKIAISFIVLVSLFVIYELITGVSSLYDLKYNIIYNKINLGLIIATSVYLIWNRLYELNKNLTWKVLNLVFWAFTILNISIALTVYLIGSKSLDHQFLNNNRSSLELMTLALTLYLVQVKSNRSFKTVMLSFVSVLLIAIVFSTRSVLLGLAVIFLWVCCTDKKLHLYYKGALLALALASLSCAVNPVFEDGNKTRLIQIKESRMQLALSLFGYNITDNIAALSLDTISTISRIGNAVGAVNSFAEHPLGRGIVKARERQVLHHGNHALLMVLLEAYGIFFLGFIIFFLVYALPGSFLIAWIPVAITSLFFANITWVVLLPLIVRNSNKLKREA